MKTKLETLALTTEKPRQLINITARIKDLVSRSGFKDGFIGLFSQHTTGTLMVSEFQDALVDDIANFLERIVDDQQFYKHNSPEFSDCTRRNAAAHLRSMLFQHGVMLPVACGELVLGEFQSVIFAEMDGPRERSLHVQFLGE